MIDASDTTDPADSFEVTFAQTSGPSATRLEDVNAYASLWRAADFDSDTMDQMQFEVTATDARGAVSRQTITIPVRGFAGPGRPIAIYDPEVTLEAYNALPFSELIASQLEFPGSSSNPNKLVFFGEDTTLGYYDYSRPDVRTLDAVFSEVSFLLSNSLGFQFFDFGGNYVEELLVLDEIEDEFSWFYQPSAAPSTYEPGGSFSIENPCYLTPRISTRQNFVWIGQRNKGFSVVRLELNVDPSGVPAIDSELLFETNDGRSLCHLYTTTFADRIYLPDFQDNSNFDNLVGIDFSSNEIVLYGDTDEDQQYEELDSFAIETQSTEPLQIVDVFSRGNSSRYPRFAAILLTNGVHDGEHRLVILTQNNDDREFNQTTYRWDSGVPMALLYDAFVGIRPNDQGRRDIVVVTSTGGQSLVLENLVPDNAGIATVPTFAAPVFFSTQPGAISAARARDDNFSDAVVAVSYPSSGEVRAYKPSEPDQ